MIGRASGSVRSEPHGLRVGERRAGQLSTTNKNPQRMVRTILIYGVLLAAGAFGLQWLEFQFVVRTHATET